MLGDVLRQFVDDVRLARRVEAGQRRHPRANEGFPIGHGLVSSLFFYARRSRATRFNAVKNVLQLRRCEASIFCPSAVRR